MDDSTEKKIIDAWHTNAGPWIEAIRNNEIQSRVDVTNRAIIDTITRLKPETVLDIGCGEGWLVRELCKTGIDALGVDVIPDLIDYALKAGAGRFQTLSYKQLAKGELNTRFDLAVANFSLLGKESVEQLFAAMPELLNRQGYFVVQTLHPVIANGEAAYIDGWREGSWDGFSDQFRDPAPWYFRTLESWQALFKQMHFQLLDTLEPAHPQTGQAVSTIFIGQIK